LAIDILSGKGLAGVDIAFLNGGEQMADPYIEDDGAEFPINNSVRCGQTQYVASFGEDQTEVDKIKTRACRVLKGKFLPKVTAPARK
jgi:hypothetical protein